MVAIVCESQRKEPTKSDLVPLLGFRSNPLLSSPQSLSSATLPMPEYARTLSPKAPAVQRGNKKQAEQRSSDSASASNGFDPGQHQMFLTNVHPPIP